jgi:hypothetical protein
MVFLKRVKVDCTLSADYYNIDIGDDIFVYSVNIN